MKKCSTLGAIAVFSGVALSAQAPGARRPADAGSAPPIQKHQLRNGLQVWIVEYHDVPIVQLSLVVLRGTGDDPPGRYGIASLTSAMLMEGAGSRTPGEIADAIDRLKGNLAPAGGVDSSSLQLHVPVEGLADALPIVADVLERPTFPAGALERVRRERLLTLQRARGDPDAIASLAFSRVVYGPAHRYGTALIGTADTVAAFTADDLRAFHASTYRPGRTAVIVAGDVVPGDVLKLLDRHFGSWQPPGVDAGVAKPQPAPPAALRRLVLVDTPDAPQSRILIGGVGAPRSTPDFFPIQVMNAVLGSRLSARLANGAAGVRSGFDMRKAPGPFAAGAAVPTDKTAESLTAFFDALGAMQQAVQADELDRAKDNAVRLLPTFEATGRLSTRLQSLESLLVYGLPDHYDDAYERAVHAVSASDVQRVAQRYIRPDRMAVVVVGDRTRIEPGLRALKLGSIAEMTIDEVFAPAPRR